MSISAIYLLDSKGRVLISRDYRGDVPATSVTERFMSMLAESEEAEVSPVLNDGELNFIYIRYNSMFRTNSFSFSFFIFIFIFFLIPFIFLCLFIYCFCLLNLFTFFFFFIL